MRPVPPRGRAAVFVAAVFLTGLTDLGAARCVRVGGGEVGRRELFVDGEAAGRERLPDSRREAAGDGESVSSEADGRLRTLLVPASSGEEQGLRGVGAGSHESNDPRENEG